MIRLSNGHKVLAAYISRPDAEGTRTSGLVLAETMTDFVTWNVWQVGHGDPLFDAQAGHYFYKRGPQHRGEDRQEAEVDFGKRLAAFLTSNAYNGLRKGCGDA